PRSPLAFRGRDWKASLRRTLEEFKEDRATLTAAGIAFFWFLAVFPALLAAVGVLGLVRASPRMTEVVTGGIATALPGDAATVLTQAVEAATQQPGRGSAVAAIAGVAVALWSASAGMVGLQRGLNVVYDVDQDRSFVKQRLVAVALLAVAAVLGGVASVLAVFGQPLGEAVRGMLPFGDAFVPLWTLIRWALTVVAVAVLFASFYYLGPNRHSPRWTWVSPGGLVAMAIWVLASLAFSFYVSSFGSYAETYGSLVGVVVLMLWLYLTALAVVLGGELNAELERQSALASGQSPAAGTTTAGAGEHDDAIRAWSQHLERVRQRRQR
ncbi:MAG: YihY/virulence factor BrkB family protein, partial [Actinomycetota bacterium]|nr:YihY/virulence factor BrkB family protein [Actinomycetota bacterium]